MYMKFSVMLINFEDNRTGDDARSAASFEYYLEVCACIGEIPLVTSRIIPRIWFSNVLQSRWLELIIKKITNYEQKFWDCLGKFEKLYGGRLKSIRGLRKIGTILKFKGKKRIYTRWKNELIKIWWILRVLNFFIKYN